MGKALWLLCLTVASLTACSKQPPTPVTFADICQRTGNQVVIEGYLRLPVMGTNCKSGRCMLNLISSMQGQVQSITAMVRNTANNSGVNAMEPLPDKLRDQDLQVHANGRKGRF